MNKTNRALLCVLSVLSLASCGKSTNSSTPRNTGGYVAPTSSVQTTSTKITSSQSTTSNNGSTTESDVISYLKRHNMGDDGQAAIYEISGTMMLSFYYVERTGEFNCVNKTVQSESGATLTTISGVTFQWGRFSAGTFATSITYNCSTGLYQATAQYDVPQSAFGKCPSITGQASANINYGTFPSSFRSTVSSIVQTQWTGILVAIAYSEKVCKQISTSCHLWGDGSAAPTSSTAQSHKANYALLKNHIVQKGSMLSTSYLYSEEYTYQKETYSIDWMYDTSLDLLRITACNYNVVYEGHYWVKTMILFEPNDFLGGGVVGMIYDVNEFGMLAFRVEGVQYNEYPSVDLTKTSVGEILQKDFDASPSILLPSVKTVYVPTLNCLYDKMQRLDPNCTLW